MSEIEKSPEDARDATAGNKADAARGETTDDSGSALIEPATSKAVEPPQASQDSQESQASQACIETARSAGRMDARMDTMPDKPVVAGIEPPAIAAPVVNLAAAAANAERGNGPGPAAVPVKIAPKPVRASTPGKPNVASPAVASGPRRFAAEHGFMAAGVAAALGVGWIVGANSFDAGANSQRLAAALEALDAKIDSVAARTAGAEDVDALRASAEKFKTSLEATRNNTAAAVAQLTNKFDRLERDQSARFDRIDKDVSARLDRFAERLDRVERAAAAPAPTASIPHAEPPPAAPRAQETRVPQTAAPTAPTADRAKIPSNGYVLREVRGGAALIQSRAGLMEVLPGDRVPGAGRVRSIERRGGQWVVVTTSGVIDAQGY